MKDTRKLYTDPAIKLLRCPLSGPTGGSGLTSFDVIVVELEDDAGTRGWGFSYVLGSGGEIALHACRDLAGQFIRGQPVVHPQVLWDQMNASLNRIGRGIHYIAMAAIDVAAWDLYAKQLEVPLGEAMGGRMRAVPVYGSGGFRPKMSAESALQKAGEYLQQGCTAIKLRMAAAPLDEALIREVRKGLPEDTLIMVDVNEKADPVMAGWLLNVCREYNVYWIEEPLAARDFQGYARLAGRADTAIAAGEHLQGLSEFMPLLQAGAIDIAQPDLAMMGGLTECLRTGRVCNSFNVPVAPHFLPSLFIHLAAALPNLSWLEDFPLLEPLFTNPLPISEGGMVIPLPDPGHGIRLSETAVDKFCIESH